MSTISVRERFCGCLLGGAVGDALGAPVEFMSGPEIVRRFGEGGIRDYEPAYGKIGAITDDTQMTLFTAEGMLRSSMFSCADGGRAELIPIMRNAYQRWLVTQGLAARSTNVNKTGWLISNSELFSQRAPGNTCISALQAGGEGLAKNDSKGCGGVMRAAPVGLMMSQGAEDNDGLRRVFEAGVASAAITHGHPTGQLATGAFAALIALLAAGRPLTEAIDRVKSELRKYAAHEETLADIEKAEGLAVSGQNSRLAIEQLGGGWIAEEALAISLYCALVTRDFETGVILAVNHGGDSDSTGSITGNLLGCVGGVVGIPERWLAPLELRDVIQTVADDMAEVARCGERGFVMVEGERKNELLRRYPPQKK